MCLWHALKCGGVKTDKKKASTSAQKDHILSHKWMTTYLYGEHNSVQEICNGIHAILAYMVKLEQYFTERI